MAQNGPILDHFGLFWKNLVIKMAKFFLNNKFNK